MIKFRAQYDWIVMGDDPGALLSAGLAARLGLSVLVVPFSPTGQGLARGVMSTKDDKFLDPESSLLLGFGASAGGPSLLGRCLEQLGITDLEKKMFVEDQALPQILTPSSRVRVLESYDAFHRELLKELGAEKLKQTGWPKALSHSEKEIHRFWTLLPEHKTSVGSKNLERRENRTKILSALRALRSGGRLRLSGKPVSQAVLNSMRGFKSSLPQEKQWFSSSALTQRGDFFQGMWSALSGNGSADVTNSHLLQLAALRVGAVTVVGGISAFRELLKQLAKRNGADVAINTECQSIFVKHGRFMGVQIHGRGEMIGGGGAMLGLPLSLATHYISDGASSAVGHSSASNWKFTLAVSVHAEAIPPGATRRILWQEAGSPFLEIELTQRKLYGFPEKKSSGCVMLARTLMPMTVESLTPQFQRLMAARMLRKMTEIFPFLDYHIEWIYPDFRVEDTQEFSATYGYESLDQVPANLLSSESPGLGVQSSIDGLFLSSRESYSELGSFAYPVSAIEAVSWAASRASLPGPFTASALNASGAQSSPRE